MAKNITLAVDEAVLDKVRKIAVDRKTTVNGMVRDFLERIARQKDEAAQARQELLKLCEASTWDPGPDWKWNREELYDRGRLGGHEHSGLRSDPKPGRPGKKKSRS